MSAAFFLQEMVLARMDIPWFLTIRFCYRMLNANLSERTFVGVVIGALGGETKPLAFFCFLLEGFGTLDQVVTLHDCGFEHLRDNRNFFAFEVIQNYIFKKVLVQDSGRLRDRTRSLLLELLEHRLGLLCWVIRKS